MNNNIIITALCIISSVTMAMEQSIEEAVKQSDVAPLARLQELQVTIEPQEHKKFVDINKDIICHINQELEANRLTIKDASHVAIGLLAAVCAARCVIKIGDPYPALLVIPSIGTCALMAYGEIKKVLTRASQLERFNRAQAVAHLLKQLNS